MGEETMGVKYLKSKFFLLINLKNYFVPFDNDQSKSL